MRMVVITSAGPRIAWFGHPAGKNLLFWDEDGTEHRGRWQLRGGHRLWTTRPGADESEETYAPDNDACRVRILRDGLQVDAPRTPAQLEKSLIIRSVPGAFRIGHRLRNAGDMLWSGGSWAITCTRPRRSTRYAIPLDGGSAGWDLLTIVTPRRWGSTHTSRLDDPQFRLREDALHFQAHGREAKRMVFAPRGRLEMRDARGHFVKVATPIAGASYPLATNVACYLAPRAFMVELETMSPIVTLVPGATLSHVEHWSLR
jgi:hypothetical protein